MLSGYRVLRCTVKIGMTEASEIGRGSHPLRIAFGKRVSARAPIEVV
jgi:hypothetical protein